MPFRHKCRYLPQEKALISAAAGICKNKSDMRIIAPIIATALGRTDCAVSKQIEICNSWFWT